jgi:hypothetical protein
MLRNKVFATALALSAIGIGACAETTGPETGSVSVTMQQSNTLTLVAGAGPAAVSAGPMASVPASQVTSLVLTISEIQLLPVVEEPPEGEEAEEAAWVTVTASDVTLDLMALPTDAENPQEIAVGELPVDSYAGVRFVVSEATIVFNTLLTVGNSQFDPDTEYEVRVPSGVIKTDLTLDVVAGTNEGDENTVSVLFGPDASFQNLTATGNGAVILNPVLKAAAVADGEEG